jgi:hypothetical protein
VEEGSVSKAYIIHTPEDLANVARIMKMCVEPVAKAPAISVAGPLRITSMAQPDNFSPARDLVHPAERRGADKALALPSRFGDKLHYRDGRVVAV